MAEGRIRIGIGGWSYEPWRGGTFYPAKWPKTRELDYAAAHLTAIEINATFYGSQKPATFAAWAKAVPDGFRFSVKASRFCTTRRVLAEGEESVGRFLGQGISELGDRLGPIVWQFAGTKRFEADDFAAFLALLPESQDGLALTHVLDVRHESFRDPAFVALARKAGAAIVHTDSPDYPAIGDATGPIRYARLLRAEADQPTGYPQHAIAGWAKLARSWATGGAAHSPFPLAAAAQPEDEAPREVYLFYINGAKERAPAAAMATIAALDGGSG